MNDPDDGMPPRNPIFFLVIVLAVTVILMFLLAELPTVDL